MRNPEFQRGASSAACTATLEYDDALAILIGHGAPLPAETIPIGRAGGRILAAPLAARVDSPQRAVAAMDGYALRSCDLAAGMTRFGVLGVTVAGDADPGRVESGQARRIMTGAAMPREGDVVMPWEEVTIDGDTIVIRDPMPRRRHVRTRGCDFASGAILLTVGTRLGPGALALAAAGNHGRVAVRPRPRIGIIASGNELVAPGRASAIGDCPDSLSLAVAQLARESGGVVIEQILLRDDPRAIEHAARATIGNNDILVVIGGAAAGDRDFAKAGLAALGLAIAFADVAMKPGKPVWYGRIGTTHVLGLPGNPLAAMTTARLFLVPLLAALSGNDPQAAMRWSDDVLTAPIAPGGGRETFLCARRSDNGLKVVPEQPASGHLAFAVSDTLVRRPANAPAMTTGDIVRSLPL